MIRVTVTDTESGETGTHELSANGYVVICSGRAYVDNEQVYGNGTRVVTIKRRPVPSNEGGNHG